MPKKKKKKKRHDQVLLIRILYYCSDNHLMFSTVLMLLLKMSAYIFYIHILCILCTYLCLLLITNCFNQVVLKERLAFANGSLNEDTLGITNYCFSLWPFA